MRLKLAWVCLRLADPLGALGALGPELLQPPPAQAAPAAAGGGAPASARALALSYAAEALCALGRCAEAAALLAPASLAQLLPGAALGEEEAGGAGLLAGAAAGGADPSEPCEPVSLSAPLPPAAPGSPLSPALRCVLATNAAAAHAALDDVASAERCCVTALRLQPRAREPLLLLAHLKLRQGARRRRALPVSAALAC